MLQYQKADSLRDLLSGAMDAYRSTVSYRLNGTMKTFAVIASLLLPLTFLTAFFAMNYACPTSLVQSRVVAFADASVPIFLSLGVHLLPFRRRHWIQRWSAGPRCTERLGPWRPTGFGAGCLSRSLPQGLP
jgi:Mg2+ and Co2+ transporter CorA